MNDDGGEVGDGVEEGASVVDAQGDAFEFLGFTEEAQFAKKSPGRATRLMRPGVACLVFNTPRRDWPELQGRAVSSIWPPGG